ncbi:hypothetical protein [Arthrobacter pityocampae]|uniref:hypothetical protein n=1 Tax=Arthrobacter pityocampae TaxID=547334 RepID=UPI0011B05C07|nr:hypothetical protein [Arthrobacter pityocampae]
MLTPASTDPATAIPLGDVTRRANVQDFLDAVRAHVPTLSLREDEALALAYLLAAQESISPANGARVRVGLARAQGHDADDLADLLALGYVYLFPMLAPNLDDYPAEPAPSPQPEARPAPSRSLRRLFTRHTR